MKPLKILLSFASLALVLQSTPASMASEPSLDKAQGAATEKREQFAAAMTDKELDGYRGGSSPIMLSNMKALLSGNSATNTVSGDNHIDGGAFSNVTGLTSVIQNSGNNVIIQSSFQVNVNIQ